MEIDTERDIPGQSRIFLPMTAQASNNSSSASFIEKKKLITQGVVAALASKKTTETLLSTKEDTDDEDEEEEVIISLIPIEKVIRIRGKRCLELRLEDFVNKIVPQFSPDSFRSHFRMRSSAMENLENLVSLDLLRQGPIGRCCIPVRKQILAAVWLLATPDSFRSVGQQFGLSKSTLHHCFRRLIHALCAIVKTQIYWPQHSEAEEVQRHFQRISGMPNVIGAIDGCQIEIDAPKEDSAAYRTGKKKYSMQLQAVCTADLLYTDVFSGYPGAVHDTRVLRNSPLFHNANQVFTGEEYIVGDKAYPVSTWCISPYKDYGNLTEAEITFNKKLSKARQVIERSFALLKGRFRRLKHLTMYRTDEISVVIMASCVLHNICLRGVHDRPEDIQEYIHDGGETSTDNDENDFLYIRNTPEGLNKRNFLKQIITGH